ncbi:MAG: efflux RND transporter periplasmic adaptor subunit [Gammaproteobacteria bacterium]|nr:efflux RND transporter periplasmic adaptor subunit [Gammaproteobacteria bacterium]MBT8110334.1 efflux RND transporter periplasmic adaptor subunit [Gammaproteobacteria bacterium]NND47681.1 efflux RND transporter periplasmic adaptor subunit [Woeseiaceae bacterium]NNL45037.1 efflux RND transporter periplasmic adaptor subunit [Woeseiaceae bacterium]
MFRFSCVAAASVSLLFASACSEAPQSAHSAQARAVDEVRVIAEVLQFERERTRVEAVGTSRARLSAELYAPTSGEVVSVNFEPGQAVQAGDVLVELDSRQEKLAVRVAELNLEDAARLYDRYKRSAESGAVLPTALDAARTAAETARVELDQARIALADRTIEAVFDGYVGSTEVDPGDRVNTNTLITTLDDRSALFVSFDIPEAFIGELAVGNEVQLETWSGKVPVVVGEIVDIGSRIDPQNRTFVARARVRNDRDALRPGMSFRVRIDVQGDFYGVVSETGVQWGADGAYVWTVVSGAAVKVPVRIVQRREGRVLVDGPLAEGNIIVVEGTQRMRDGLAVSYDLQRMAGKPDIEPVSGAAKVTGRPLVVLD